MSKASHYGKVFRLPFATGVRLRYAAKYLEIAVADLLDLMLKDAAIPDLPEKRELKNIVSARWRDYKEVVEKEGLEQEMQDFFMQKYSQDAANDK